MTPQEKHKQEVLWKNAKASKLARKEIAKSTAKHKSATARGRLAAVRDSLNTL